MTANNLDYQAIGQLIKKEALHETYEAIASKNFTQQRKKTKSVNASKPTDADGNPSIDLANLIADIEIDDSRLISKNGKLMSLIKDLLPWRKGPFTLGDFTIESEWNSLLKWQRIVATLESKISTNTASLNVLDIGCNNGYFLFKIASLLKEKEEKNQRYDKRSLPFLKDTFLIGIDPTHLYQLQYLLIKKIKTALCLKENRNSMVLFDRIHFLPLGFQDLHYFKPSFDLALCMGITYHHPNPIAVVQSVYGILKKGGSAIFECMGLEDSRIEIENSKIPFFFLPEKTYLGKKGFWFMPTLTGLKAMLKRCGFTCHTLTSIKLEEDEQQTSKHAPYASLSQGLTKQKQAQTTVEGYPTPCRHYVVAQKQ